MVQTNPINQSYVSSCSILQKAADLARCQGSDSDFCVDDAVQCLVIAAIEAGLGALVSEYANPSALEEFCDIVGSSTRVDEYLEMIFAEEKESPSPPACERFRSPGKRRSDTPTRAGRGLRRPVQGRAGAGR